MTKKEIVIKQSNDLIRALPFRDNDFRISLTQKRILYHFINKIIQRDYEHRNGKNWIEIDPNELINQVCPEKTGRRGSNSTLVALEELDKFKTKKYQMVLRYKDNNGNEIIRHTQWVLEMETIVASGKIDIHFPNVIIENVMNLKGFYTAVPMESVLEAKSSNQIKLYEILLSYASMGEISLTPKKIKEHLEIDQNSYAKFKHFKEKVLDVCCKYINEQNLIHVDFQVIRDDRQRPITIDFKISYLEDKKPKKKSEDLTEKHRYYWEQHQFNYSNLNPFADGVRLPNGNELRFSSKDFIDAISEFIEDNSDIIKNRISKQEEIDQRMGKENRRQPFVLLHGASERRKNHGRRPGDKS